MLIALRNRYEFKYSVSKLIKMKYKSQKFYYFLN